MRRYMSAIVLLAILWGGFGRTAQAWNKSGHMVVAGIAYRDLKKSNPEKAGKVIALLKEHPHFESRWKQQLAPVPDEDKDQYLFMLAARWPDDIRGNNTFDRPKDHFIDFPFVPPGQPGDIHGVDPDTQNLVSSFAANRAALSSGTDKARQAIALAWVFHQVGDVHQPLHTVSLFSTQFPTTEGDRGGTRFYIRANAGTNTVSLHKLWDDFLGSSNRFSTVRNRATGLLNRPDMARGTFPQISSNDVGDWAKEGFAAAKAVVYRDGDLEGSTDKNDGEVLPDDYLPEAQTFAERQVALAGYRLADFLKSAF